MGLCPIVASITLKMLLFIKAPVVINLIHNDILIQMVTQSKWPNPHAMISSSYFQTTWEQHPNDDA